MEAIKLMRMLLFLLILCKCNCKRRPKYGRIASKFYPSNYFNRGPTQKIWKSQRNQVRQVQPFHGVPQTHRPYMDTNTFWNPQQQYRDSDVVFSRRYSKFPFFHVTYIRDIPMSPVNDDNQFKRGATHIPILSPPSLLPCLHESFHKKSQSWLCSPYSDGELEAILPTELCIGDQIQIYNSGFDTKEFEFAFNRCCEMQLPCLSGTPSWRILLLAKYYFAQV